MEPQLSCLPGTKGTNNHIKQGDACFFAPNPIGVTYYRLTAMLTILCHKFSPDSDDLRNENIPYQIQFIYVQCFLTNSTNGRDLFLVCEKLITNIFLWS